MIIKFWKDGEKNRPLKLYTPCDCGCDYRDRDINHPLPGYLSASDEDGNGFSIWIENYATFDAIAKEIEKIELTKYREQRKGSLTLIKPRQ